MIIKQITESGGVIPFASYSSVGNWENGGNTNVRIGGYGGYTSTYSYIGYYDSHTRRGSTAYKEDANGNTYNVNDRWTYITESYKGSVTESGLSTGERKGETTGEGYFHIENYTVSSTTTRHEVAGDESLSFSTTTTSISSAKVVSVGTYTFLSATTGSTTTSRPIRTNYKNITTATITGESLVYSNRQVQGARRQTYAKTRWEVFDNGDDFSVVKVVAGAGGLPSYEVLPDGYVVGEAGYDVEEGQVEVRTYNSGATYEESTMPTFESTSSWTEGITSESSYRETEEVWNPVQTTREGYTETTVETTTELFGTETTITVDATTTYVEEYEDYTSTTQLGYENWETVTETSAISTYRVTKTANRAWIGSVHTIESWGSTETTYKTTSTSQTYQYGKGNKTLYTGVGVVTYEKNDQFATKYNDNGAFIADRMFLYLTTRNTSTEAASSQGYTIDAFTVRPVVVVWPSVQYQGNYISSFQTVSGVNGYAVINGNGYDNFFLEPVGSPCIGGINRTGDYLELEDNCPHSFPAIMLWQGAFDSSHAAPSASSFYEGGVPLISHQETWEYSSRTYSWITADGTEGKLKVSGEENSTSTSSTTFTIKVKGNRSYTGGNLTTQAGGKYFSDRKATLFANCPLVVSIQGGTKSFGRGVHEITEPMRRDIRSPAGSVVYSGTQRIGPTYFPYNNIYIDTFRL